MKTAKEWADELDFYGPLPNAEQVIQAAVNEAKAELLAVIVKAHAALTDIDQDRVRERWLAGVAILEAGVPALRPRVVMKPDYPTNYSMEVVVKKP